MNISGEIVLDIYDEKKLEIDLGKDILPTKFIRKGEEVALGRRAPKNRWMHEIKFNNEKEYIVSLEKLVDRLHKKNEYIKGLEKKYEGIEINIYIRSDFAQIGYSLPNNIIKKMALLECNFNFEILSFGMVMSKDTVSTQHVE